MIYVFKHIHTLLSNRKHLFLWALCAWVVIFSLSQAFGQPTGAKSARINQYISHIEQLRQDLSIPGLGVAIVQNGSLRWAGGLGYANLEAQTPVTKHTPFHVASVTKTFAAVAIMQLVENGHISLDDPANKFGIDLPSSVTVRHLLSHTSASAPPGQSFAYDGNRYALLEKVFPQVTGKDFGNYLIAQFIERLYMTNTTLADGRMHTDDTREIAFDKVQELVAKPYSYAGGGKQSAAAYNNYFGTSAGLVTSAYDLAKYAAALQIGALLTHETMDEMWRPTADHNGNPLPYGLGWFTQTYDNIPIAFHYGQWNGCSSLLLMVPQTSSALILLANNQRLASVFDFQSEHGLSGHPMALSFLHLFVSERGKLPALPAYAAADTLARFLKKANKTDAKVYYAYELCQLAATYRKIGLEELAKSWLSTYHEAAGLPLRAKLHTGDVLAEIVNVGNDANKQQVFELSEACRARVVAIGEANGQNSQMLDYAWLARKGDTEPVWQMSVSSAKHAGGSLRNRKEMAVLELPPGKYTLHYKSDKGHAWLKWTDSPPETDFYGVIVQLMPKVASTK